MLARDFQHWLMERLGIPLLNFPKGNPMSGQTWPELSFRTLLRHIYRQQRFWTDLADKQPEAEQHACLLQFLGLAKGIYADEYGRLIDLRMRIERLRSRREQFGQTLEILARDIVAEPELSVAVNTSSVRTARARLHDKINDLQKRRAEYLADGSRRGISRENRGRIVELAKKRAETLGRIEDERKRLAATMERLAELRRYRADLENEINRISRAQDAGAVFADLKITHCPACDQAVGRDDAGDSCFLCHQTMPNDIPMKELGSVRLRFERDRLAAELKEADELISAIFKESTSLSAAIKAAEDESGLIERELAPARDAVSALVQEDVSALDVALGQASERERQLGRVADALGMENDISSQIAALEKEIEPLRQRVDELIRATDFDAAASKLEDGMNSYLNALNVLRPNVWKHNQIRIDITRSNFSMRVGKRRWHVALGGTDALYFLMAYQYGLLTLSPDPQTHYPGLVIIDVPGEFSGEAVGDKENFIVQPFIDLARTQAFVGVQLIMTGASFAGLEGVNFVRLSEIFVA